MRHPSLAIEHGQARSTSVPVTVGRTVNGLRCVCFARNFAVEGKEREAFWPLAHLVCCSGAVASCQPASECPQLAALVAFQMR
jgi:hypothetical protein